MKEREIGGPTIAQTIAQPVPVKCRCGGRVGPTDDPDEFACLMGCGARFYGTRAILRSEITAQEAHRLSNRQYAQRQTLREREGQAA